MVVFLLKVGAYRRQNSSASTPTTGSFASIVGGSGAGDTSGAWLSFGALRPRNPLDENVNIRLAN